MMLGLTMNSSWEEVETLLNSLHYNIDYDHKFKEYVVSCEELDGFFVADSNLRRALTETMDLVEAEILSHTQFEGFTLVAVSD